MIAQHSQIQHICKFVLLYQNSISLLNLQFTHCLHSFTHCLWDAHSFVGARGQVRPTGVSGGECQGHQQSLTPLSKPQIPLSKPPTPKPHQSSHPLMCFTTGQPKQCKCVSVYQYHHQMYQQLQSNVSDWFCFVIIFRPHKYLSIGPSLKRLLCLLYILESCVSYMTTFECSIC